MICKLVETRKLKFLSRDELIDLIWFLVTDPVYSKQATRFRYIFKTPVAIPMNSKLYLNGGPTRFTRNECHVFQVVVVDHKNITIYFADSCITSERLDLLGETFSRVSGYHTSLCSRTVLRIILTHLAHEHHTTLREIVNKYRSI